MLVRCFCTLVLKTSYSSWTPLLELLSAQAGSMMMAQNTQMRESPPDSQGCCPRNSTFPFPPPAGGRMRDGCSRNYLVSSSLPTPFSMPFPWSPRSACHSPPSLTALPLGVHGLIGGSSSPSSSMIVAGACAAMAFSCARVLSKQYHRNTWKAPHHSWYSPSQSLRCVHNPWNCTKCFIVVSSIKRM